MSIPSRSERAPILAGLFVAIALTAAPSARADDDPMAPFRERFRSGMERYVAGDVAAAIRFWEPIYGELGPSKGYRVSYDLARAYEKFGDLARAAERYESFLAEVERRRAAGQAIEAKVAAEEQESKQRLAEIQSTRGRIKIAAGAHATSVRIDALDARIAPFVVVVTPGVHDVTFDAGTPAERTQRVEVAAGQVVEVAPPAPVIAPAPSAPQTPPASPREATPPPPATPPPAQPAVVTRETAHPFSPWLVYTAGALTVASGVVCAVEYARALSIKHDFESSPGASLDVQQGRVNDYGDARTLAYVTLGVTAGLAAVTGGLATWYFAGAKERDGSASIAPAIVPMRGGGAVGVGGRF